MEYTEIPAKQASVPLGRIAEESEMPRLLVLAAALLAAPSIFALGMTSLMGCIMSIGVACEFIGDLIYGSAKDFGSIHLEIYLWAPFTLMLLGGPCGLVALILLMSVTMLRLGRRVQSHRLASRLFGLAIVIGFPFWMFFFWFFGFRSPIEEASGERLIADGWLLLPLVAVLAMDIVVFPSIRARL